MIKSTYEEAYNTVYLLYKKGDEKGLKIEADFYAKKAYDLIIKNKLKGDVCEKVGAFGLIFLRFLTEGKRGIRNLFLCIFFVVVLFGIVYYFSGAIYKKELSYSGKAKSVMKEKWKQLNVQDALYLSSITFLGFSDGRFIPRKYENIVDSLIIVEAFLGLVALGLMIHIILRRTLEGTIKE